MTELLTTKERLSRLFYYLANCYDSQRFPDFKAVYQFILTEGGERYAFYVSISAGRGESFEGEVNDPLLLISSSVSDWFDLLNGTLNPFWALLTGKCRSKGKFYCLYQMRKIFGRRFDHRGIPEMGNRVENHEIPARRVWKKPNKVLVINGSQRRKDGTTYFYLQHFLQGIKSTGCEVELVDIYDHNTRIEPCRGCFSCWTQTQGQCTINDDARALLEKIDDAYLTIYAFPLYTGLVPAKLTLFLNRHIKILSPYWISYRGINRHSRLSVKEQYIALFSTYAIPDASYFNPYREIFRLFAIQTRRPVVATILRPGGEELYQNISCGRFLKIVLASLEDAGRDLVTKGKIPSGTLRAISKNYISSHRWRRSLNMYWHLKNKK